MGHGKCLTAHEDTGFSFHNLSKGLTYWYQKKENFKWFFKHPTPGVSWKVTKDSRKPVFFLIQKQC